MGELHVNGFHWENESDTRSRLNHNESFLHTTKKGRRKSGDVHAKETRDTLNVCVHVEAKRCTVSILSDVEM